jgi:uncharacterized protein (TIGR01777 family)
MVAVHILLAGASGFLGSALRHYWRERNHEVSSLVRREPQNESQHRWDPHSGHIDPKLIESADLVVNTAGAPVSRWPWTDRYKTTLLESRTKTTGTLASAIARSTRKPTLLNQSGATYYGDRGDDLLAEDEPPGDSVLAKVAVEWEAATLPAAQSGARVCVMRSGIVLDRTGGMLAIVKWPFRLGVGGRLGSGRQWFPSISLDDYVRAVDWMATHDDCSGTYNVSSPDPGTNADFTRALGIRLHRPTVIPVPAIALRTALGAGLSNELLGSFRVVPRRLLDSGFRFKHPSIGDQVAAAFP